MEPGSFGTKMERILLKNSVFRDVVHCQVNTAHEGSKNAINFRLYYVDFCELALFK